MSNDEEILASFNAEERRQWSTLSAEDKEAVRDSFKQRVPESADLRALTRQLFSRLIARDWRILSRQHSEGARIHECVANAEAWVHAHPGDRVAHGYLFIYYGELYRHVRFVPHVGVLTKAGAWIDVTPHNSSVDRPFLQHAGTDEEFQVALNNGPMDLIYR